MPSTATARQPFRVTTTAAAGTRQHTGTYPAEPGDAERVSRCLADHPQWSACWDKRFGVWRVTADDPDSDLYAESSDVGTVISYFMAHT